MNAEDRVRAALSDRAGRARTSSDALDGVFTRVARHRRNVRLAAAGATLSLVAVAAAALATTRPPRAPFVVRPTPAVTVPATPTPTHTVPPSAPDRAFVFLEGDDHIVEVDTTTGEVLRDVVEARGTVEDLTTDADRGLLAFANGCRVTVVDTRTGVTRRLDGRTPALSPDGRSLATTRCPDGAIVVTDLATNERTVYAPRRSSSLPPQSIDIETVTTPSSLAWLDARHIVIARTYETAEETLVLDLRTDRSLADASGTTYGFHRVTALHGEVVGVETCCMPEWDTPAKVARLHAGRREVLFETRLPEVSQVASDHTGAILYTDSTGLWRWDGKGAPELLLRGVALDVAG